MFTCCLAGFYMLPADHLCSVVLPLLLFKLDFACPVFQATWGADVDLGHRVGRSNQYAVPRGAGGWNLKRSKIN